MRPHPIEIFRTFLQTQLTPWANPTLRRKSCSPLLGEGLRLAQQFNFCQMLTHQVQRHPHLYTPFLGPKFQAHNCLANTMFIGFPSMFRGKLIHSVAPSNLFHWHESLLFHQAMRSCTWDTESIGWFQVMENPYTTFTFALSWHLGFVSRTFGGKMGLSKFDVPVVDSYLC